MDRLRLAQLRRIAIRAQGFATRSRAATASEVEAAIRRLGVVQLDSIATVDRSHRIALSTRVGEHPAGTLSRLLSSGRVFEYWAHEASVLPIEAWPLMRLRMREGRVHRWWGDVIGGDPRLARRVLAAIERNGPMSSRDFEGAPPAGRGMWNLKPEKRMLDALWTAGRLVVRGRESGFQRVYDLPERVIPDRVREAPAVPRPAMLRALALDAIRARGALTESGVAEHWRVTGRTATIRPALARLVREGEVLRLPVEDGGPDVYVPADADLDAPAPRAAALLSPFDNLLWDRPFARRALGFDHLIEVYKKERERRFGYYVMPLVMGDAIVARADVKTDREAGMLRVKRVHREAGVCWTSAHDDGLAKAAARLARHVGVPQVSLPA